MNPVHLVRFERLERVIEEGPALGEGFKSDNKLEVPEVQNRPATQVQVAKKLQGMVNNRRTLGPEHPSTVESMNKLVSTYWQRNQWQEAAKLLEQVLAVRDAKLSEYHPPTQANMRNMMWSHRRQGR
ncbi:Tetratricopeptide-like helical [Penicillium robsamsonii]|uniref:Tetratricopeptide-like helical n=1 Tax=Penicillium robsamsonii TaxID=1792511 RepID=UPI002547EB25|nr:Tetratricopeptide-like helical [Penicillium robsamsonii]KAJ5813194.1 Tetratricopeptide-like helical [Penicillium robsamsonii]